METMCDESKCVATGLSAGSFTCYGDNEDFYMMCADGYLPTVVEDEPQVGSFQYFTCCPPTYSSINVTRHCSDPIMDPGFFAAEGNGTDYCSEEETRTIPSPMQIPSVFATYMCCEDTEDGNTTSFLEETECVPYRNAFYTEAKVENEYGKLVPMECNLPEFPFAEQLYDKEGNYDPLSGRYQCCKTGPSTLQPFVEDDAFLITVYVGLALHLALIIASSVIILSLTVPLIIQLRNGVLKERQSSQSSRRWTLSRLSRLSRLSGRSGQSSSLGRRDDPVSARSRGGSVASRLSARSIRKEERFSSYNLYLLYLALVDLIVSIFEVILYSGMVAQKYSIEFYPYIVAPFGELFSVLYSLEWAITVAYTVANLYLNAIVAYEVMVLLRTSKNMRRARPPSLTRVTLQALSVTILALMVFAIDFFVRKAAWREFNLGNFERSSSLLTALPIWNTTITAGSYIVTLGVVFWIWWKGYMPKASTASAQKRALRELSFYFFRIIAVFTAVWAPNIVIANYCFYNNLSWGMATVNYAGPVQGILTTCLILTKSDVRQYVWDLFTFSYCLPYFGCCSKDEYEDAKEEVKDKKETDHTAPNAVSELSVANDPHELSGSGYDCISSSFRPAASGTFRPCGSAILGSAVVAKGSGKHNASGFINENADSPRDSFVDFSEDIEETDHSAHSVGGKL